MPLDGRTMAAEVAHMNIETENFDGGILQVKLAGRMDAQGTEEINQEFMDCACSERSVIVDMTAVGFLASMGLRTLLLVAKAVSRRGGKMVLLNPDTNVTKILEMARIDSLIPIHRSLDEARRAVSI
jgi:anti-sigma B factor antagonist